MNAAQVKEIAKVVTESTLDFLAAKHNTTAQVIADLIGAGHENVSAQFFKLMEIGLNQACAHVAVTNNATR
jgi:hypothetical protein